MSKLEKDISTLLEKNGMQWQDHKSLASGIKDLVASSSLEGVKETYLNTDRVKESVQCPVCEKTISIQTVPLSKIHCELLIKACKIDAGGKKYFHMDRDLEVPIKVGGGWAKLKHWGLIEAQPNPKDPKTTVQGMWCVTIKAMEFIGQKITLPSKVYIYNAKKTSEHREQVSIVDVIGDFDEYTKLMSHKSTKDNSQDNEDETYKAPKLS